MGPSPGHTGSITWQLSRQHIDVWVVRLSATEELLGEFERVLAPDEAARARAFRFEHLRHRYVLARGTLRFLLGGYLDADPAALRFSCGPRGKPKLEAPSLLTFNVSHSADLGLFGVALECDIGVDVELIRNVEDMLGIATRFFCPEETQELMSLSPSDRERAFLLCWTRKEAYLKAIGDGLHAPLGSFRVTLRPSEAARFVHINGSSAAAAQWTLHNLEPIPSCASALAYQGPARSVRLMPVLTPARLIAECGRLNCREL